MAGDTTATLPLEVQNPQPIMEKKHHTPDQERDTRHHSVAVRGAEAHHEEIDPDLRGSAQRPLVLFREEEKDQRREEAHDQNPVIDRRPAVARHPEGQDGPMDLLHEIPLSKPRDAERRIDAENERDRPAREPVPLRKEAREEQDAERERDQEQEVAAVGEVMDHGVEQVGLHDGVVHEHHVVARRDADEQVLTHLIGRVVLVEEAEYPQRQERCDPDPNVVAHEPPPWFFAAERCGSAARFPRRIMKAMKMCASDCASMPRVASAGCWTSTSYSAAPAMP